MKNSRFGALWFFRKFTEAITWEKYAESYKNDADFTPNVIREINRIIKDGTGWEAQNEYFRIDAVGWETHYEKIKSEANALGLNAHLWDLKIAVEHENNKHDWTDELIKLMQLRCPLKVVIGYNYCDMRGENEKEKLRFAAKSIRFTSAYPGAARDREELLLILGNGCSSKTGKSEYTDFGYRGYLFDYDEARFLDVEGN